MTKNMIVKVTLAGTEIVDFVVISNVKQDMTGEELYKIIEQADTTLRSDEAIENDEGYYFHGWDIMTLMDKVCEDNDWTWEYIKADADFTIEE